MNAAAQTDTSKVWCGAWDKSQAIYDRAHRLNREKAEAVETCQGWQAWTRTSDKLVKRESRERGRMGAWA